jgi:geranylgeranyl diphosphate synthase type II
VGETFNLKAYLEERRNLVNRALEGYLPRVRGPAFRVTQAMHYSLFVGGKRLRPILCLAAAEAVQGDPGEALPVACALEMIHTYSLIHDDLPAMDDDDLRRGQPTCHKQFDEATAILAGDGLLTQAFHIMAEAAPRYEGQEAVLLEVIRLLADAAGYQGMVGGQMLDLLAEGRQVTLKELETIHRYWRPPGNGPKDWWRTPSPPWTLFRSGPSPYGNWPAISWCGGPNRSWLSSFSKKINLFYRLEFGKL